MAPNTKTGRPQKYKSPTQITIRTEEELKEKLEKIVREKTGRREGILRLYCCRVRTKGSDLTGRGYKNIR